MGIRSKVSLRGALYTAVLVLVASLAGGKVRAQSDPGLNCPDGQGGFVSVNNNQVLHWKFSTRNTFLARGNVVGTIVGILPSIPTHIHFVIQIGQHFSHRNLCTSDAVEVIYNRDFGDVNPKDLYLGAQVQACGDYITSNAPNGRYHASKACAIVHWVHINPKQTPHAHGYLRVNGDLYGRFYNERAGGDEPARP